MTLSLVPSGGTHEPGIGHSQQGTEGGRRGHSQPKAKFVGTAENLGGVLMDD